MVGVGSAQDESGPPRARKSVYSCGRSHPSAPLPDLSSVTALRLRLLDVCGIKARVMVRAGDACQGFSTLGYPRFEGCTRIFYACGSQKFDLYLRVPFWRSHAHGGPLSYGEPCTNSFGAQGATPPTLNPRHAAFSCGCGGMARRLGMPDILECCSPSPHAPSTGSFAHPPDSKLRARLLLGDAGSALVRPPFDHPPVPAHLLRRPVLTKH